MSLLAPVRRKDSGPNDARIVLRNCAPSPLHCAHLLARRQVLELDIHDDYKTTDCKEFLRVMLAVGETFILLHPPLPLVGVSMWVKRGCQSNDRTLADG